MFGKPVASGVIVELVALALIICGLGLGVVALFGIPKHGSSKILMPSLVGMTINGLLLFIFITNFFAARAKIMNQSAMPVEVKSQMGVVSQKEFKNGKITFQYDGRYQLQIVGERGQIMLQCPDSDVVITDHGHQLDLADTIRKMAAAIKADFEQHNYKDISEGEFENFETKNISGSRVKLEYTRPENLRVVAEIYLISIKNNLYSFLHYYPQTQSTVATSLFQTVFNSFSQDDSATQAR